MITLKVRACTIKTDTVHSRNTKHVIERKFRCAVVGYTDRKYHYAVYELLIKRFFVCAVVFFGSSSYCGASGHREPRIICMLLDQVRGCCRNGGSLRLIEIGRFYVSARIFQPCDVK